MLEHLSPWEYQAIRKVLGHGSGFDSPGFREIRARDAAARRRPSTRCVREAGLNVVELYRRGREHEELYQLAELLIGWDERVGAVADPALPGRRARDRRRGRRHAGHAGRAARRPDQAALYPELWQARNRLTELANEEDVTLRDEVTAAPAGADPPRHGQPARERDAGGRAPARLPRRRTASSASCTRRRPSGRTSSRESRARRRPAPAAALAHGHGARRRGGVAGRSLVGRAARQRGLGPRRTRHEGPGRRRGGRDRLARARGLRAGRRPDLRGHRRRGGRRRLRAPVALRAPSGRGPRRVRAQRGRRRPDRARRPGLLPLLERREDELAVPAAASTGARATRRCPGSPTTRSSRRRR